MILKDGKFFDDDGNVVPIEHGNIEQIEILKQIEEARFMSWVSVNEHLPKPGKHVLIATSDSKRYPSRGYIKDSDNEWYAYYFHGVMKVSDNQDTVLYWMEMPKMPKI